MYNALLPHFHMHPTAQWLQPNKDPRKWRGTRSIIKKDVEDKVPSGCSNKWQCLLCTSCHQQNIYVTVLLLFLKKRELKWGEGQPNWKVYPGWPPLPKWNCWKPGPAPPPKNVWKIWLGSISERRIVQIECLYLLRLPCNIVNLKACIGVLFVGDNFSKSFAKFLFHTKNDITSDKNWSRKLLCLFNYSFTVIELKIEVLNNLLNNL